VPSGLGGEIHLVTELASLLAAADRLEVELCLSAAAQVCPLLAAVVYLSAAQQMYLLALV